MSTTAETRTCFHCARDIEWIEADGQGAWYDSSNRTGCADGETPHAAPLCGSCDDYGVIEIRHASTDGLIGHRPCNDPLCADRRAKAAARAAEKHTGEMIIGAEEFGPQVCAACGFGGYTPVPGLFSHGQPVYVCTARGCGYRAGHDAFPLEAGERLAVHDDRLYVARPYDGPPF
ncbi:MAG: hypothetical protein HOY79_06065 [Streptomyces sp.]|nr:hypothetical protein [Streptomyces sp.]